MNADFEHQTRSPDSDWSEYYADQFMDRCAPSESPAEDKLALYHYTGRPFCAMVTAGIDRLGLEVELRDIFENRGALDAGVTRYPALSREGRGMKVHEHDRGSKSTGCERADEAAENG